MKSPPTVSVLVARLLVQVAEARGAGVAPLLTKAGVALHHSVSGPRHIEPDGRSLPHPAHRRGVFRSGL
jgi:hypothetical protein